MSLYTRDSIERVREGVDMLELVGTRTDLRRVGSRWVGLCPFHDERTPSFTVQPDRKFYYCFGCEANGDAIGFVRETEALEFREAVELLAERYGVELELEREDPRAEERRRRRERLYALLDRTTRFYATYLWESAEAAPAREYLSGRGLAEEVLRDFRIGYAPSAWDRVITAAQRDGFRPEELAAAGLGQTGRQGGFFDRFRARIMFPLADARGRVLGFGARAVRESQQPKYLNTSENELYHKGRQLFGIDRARAPIAQARRVVVVEGYTDVLALHQAGIPETVAIMGTALTQEQLTELARAVGGDGTILLALDADRSGHDAMMRAARGAQDVELRVVDLPDGRDPADLIAEEGKGGLGARIESALSVPEFQVRHVLADADLDTPAGRDRALQEARPLIDATRERPALRDRLAQLIADELDIRPRDVLSQLSAPVPRRAPEPAPRSPRVGGVAISRLEDEHAFLTTCARSPEHGRDYLAKLSDEHLSSELSRRVRDHLMTHFDDPLAEVPEDDPDFGRLVTRIALEASEPSHDHESVLRMSFLNLELRRIERGLRQATEQGDMARQGELAGERVDVQRELDSVMEQTG